MINEDASEGRPSESRTSLHDPVYKKGRLETEVVNLGGTDDWPRRSQCPELDKYDYDNDKVPVDPEILWDLLLKLDLLRCIRSDGIHPRILKDGKPYEEQLRSVGLFSLEEAEGRPHCSDNFLVRGRGRADTALFSVVSSDRT
ncbi:hypothetical protein DUI87_23702 [Hirundo rustica rustica]|uniref:Uncharacterized protein n=1 Tax=Hirundo rustica rustica TaxID=333673 RepID=A0A3M0JH51_HIRRU|nr:hypothetical protein DUI87_23702 [Hirundo rustica rustica]